MERYQKYVDECRRDKLPDIIDNSSLAHAEVITKSLMQFATEQELPIRIISGSLYEGFWNPIEPLFEKYFNKLQQKARVEIVIINAYQNLDMSNNLVYRQLESHPKQVHIHNGIDKSIINNQAHFILIGNVAYRKERSQNRALATASFNDRINGEWLLETFNFVTSYIRTPSLLALQAV